MKLSDVVAGLRRPIKVYWWRLNAAHGNFGDEITKEIIGSVFHRRVQWSPPESCDLIGAGSVIEVAIEKKGENKPFLWGTGFIQEGESTISTDDYRIVGVRGRSTLERIVGVTSDVQLGDVGLLANYLLKEMPRKEFQLGVVAHWTEKDHEVVGRLGSDSRQVNVIDVTGPCREVIREIAKCETIVSSSLHGLIAADSLHVPNIHIKLTELKGREYKFADYYSIYGDNEYEHITPEDLENKDLESITRLIKASYGERAGIEEMKKRLVASFPLR